MTIWHDLSLGFQLHLLDAVFRVRKCPELNPTAYNPLGPSVPAAIYTQRTSAMRFVTRRNYLSQARDRDGPFLQGLTFLTRTILITPRRLLPLSHSSASPPPFRNPLG